MLYFSFKQQVFTSYSHPYTITPHHMKHPHPPAMQCNTGPQAAGHKDMLSST